MTPIIAMATVIAVAIVILAILILKVRKTMINCKTCRNTKNCVYAGADREMEECVDRIPTTHSDIIHSMTDEELAEYLFARGNEEEYCYGICAYQDECDTIQSRGFCLQQIVKWLREEVEA